MQMKKQIKTVKKNHFFPFLDVLFLNYIWKTDLTKRLVSSA